MITIGVDEICSQLLSKYLRAGYGDDPEANTKAAALSLVGSLQRLLADGDRDDVRGALRIFKDQGTSHSGSPRRHHTHPPPAAMFALYDAAVKTAEKLRQFSSSRSAAHDAAVILEELRLRLFRMIGGDGPVAYRRMALDCCYRHMRREAALGARAVGSSSNGANTAATAAGSKNLFGAFVQHQKQRIAGPCCSSWRGLWDSLSTVPGPKLFPLMQSIMDEFHTSTSASDQPGRLPSAPSTPGAPSASVASTLTATTATAAAATPTAEAAQCCSPFELDDIAQDSDVQLQLPRSSRRHTPKSDWAPPKLHQLERRMLKSLEELNLQDSDSPPPSSTRSTGAGSFGARSLFSRSPGGAVSQSAPTNTNTNANGGSVAEHGWADFSTSSPNNAFSGNRSTDAQVTAQILPPPGARANILKLASPGHG